MLRLKDIESYVKVKEYMGKNNINDIDSLANSLMIVKDENGNERKFYSLSSGAKFIGVSFAIMHYVHKNRRTRISKRVGGQKTIQYGLFLKQ